MRRVWAALALLVACVACSSEPIPPVPEDLRRMTEQETSCIVCHARAGAPSLAPGETTTPRAHPSFDPDEVRELLEGR